MRGHYSQILSEEGSLVKRERERESAASTAEGKHIRAKKRKATRNGGAKLSDINVREKKSGEQKRIMEDVTREVSPARSVSR